MSVKEALDLGKKHDVKYVDLEVHRFRVVWQHTQIPANRLNEGLFEGRPRLRVPAPPIRPRRCSAARRSPRT